ncbi:MAG: hypothetical protein A2040_11840 [Rhodocyclales bacterium GWA2_65_19]|nr:MAG: hypothetical protein A2040_11840 [Rhodocyclales bacterium GWA2_65_19]
MKMKLPNNSFKSFAARLSAGVIMLAAGIGIAHAATSFTPKDQPFGTLPPIALSGFNVSTGSQFSFDPWFDPVTWKGDLSAFPIDSTGHSTLNNKLWSAADQVNAQDWNTGRRIVTRNSAGTAVPFRDASPGLSASQVTAIGGTNAVNFIRGDRSNEKQLTTTEGGVTVVVNTGSSATGTLRGRYSVLGDIMHARAAYVGAPPADYTFDSYQTYKSNNLTRAGRVYVGANDGMVHSFDASTGDEVFAYIPSMLISNLSKLTVDPYDHNYYVDGGLTGGDVNFGTTGTPDWRTVLVGGLGAGGKGIYALDVSVATAADETAAKAKILWEISSTSTNFGDLGYTYGDPSIVRTNDGKWAVLVSNGYLSSSGKAVLYVIDVETGLLIRAIDTGSGSVASPNGLSTPTAIDTNLDGIMDYVYAGDIDGNVWKFDIRNADPTLWSKTQLHTAEHTPGKAIIGAPEVAAHPTSGYLVYFATGRLFSATEAADTTAQNYVYAVWDGASTTSPGRSFVEQTLSTGSWGGALAVRVATDNVPNWTAVNRCDEVPLPTPPATCDPLLDVPPHKGWKTPLPVGEHIVSGGFVRDGRYHLVALNAAQVNSTRPNGANWLMELNHLTGGAPTKLVFDLNADGLLTDADRATDTDGVAITTSLGVPLGMNLGAGMFSMPTLVLISSTLNTTLFNNNPYVSAGNTPDTPPEEETGGRGVSGGHFDVDIYYHNNGARICTYTGGTTTTGIDAQYQIVVTSTGNSYAANVGQISLGATAIADAFSVTNGTATTTNATTLKNAINSKASGYTATSSGNTVTITAPTGSYASGNGLSFTKVAGSVTAPTVAGTPAVGKIVINAPPAGASRITGVTFNSVGILASTVGFAAGSTRSQIAAALNAALTNPANFTRSITTTNVANDTITFTQTANGGAAPTISVASTAGSFGAVYPTGLVAFGGTGKTSSSNSAKIDDTLGTDVGRSDSIWVGSTRVSTSEITIGQNKTPADAANALVSAIGVGGTIQAYIGGSQISTICSSAPVTTVCLIDTGSYTNGKAVKLGAPKTASYWNSVTYEQTGTATAGGVAATAASVQSTTVSASAGTAATGGVDDLAPFLVTSQSRTGQDAGDIGGTLVNCPRIQHVHEYDDKYDVTGVNMLNASDSAYNLSNYISNSTEFKIIAHNQYLSPAVTLDIGGSGAVSVKDFGTAATLAVADLTTYTLASAGFTLQFDMPREAFSHKDWWGNGDDRVGLHPTNYSCAVPSRGAIDGQMYQPVDPPDNGTDGPGTNGWDTGSKISPTTSTGARHNGSLTIQVIKATTPDSALELNIPGKPEYGWRIRAADFETYVLAEYIVFWHHPENICFGAAGFTKQAAQDPTSCFTDQIISGKTGTEAAAACYSTPASGSSDPGQGTRRALVTGTTSTTTITGTGMSSVKTVTVTITYDDGSTLVVTTTYTARSLNSDGSVSRWNTGQSTTVFTAGTGDGSVANEGNAGTNLNQSSSITSTITGYQQSRNSGKLGRVSWRELIRE